jgi:hypothetical protein
VIHVMQPEAIDLALVSPTLMARVALQYGRDGHAEQWHVGSVLGCMLAEGEDDVLADHGDLHCTSAGGPGGSRAASERLTGSP